MSVDVAELFRRALDANRLIRPGDRVLAAVSGGADSVALLHLLWTAASSFPFTLEVAHLDHGLRRESRADAEFVQNLCSRWRLPLTVERIDVARAAARDRLGLEEAGRNLRRMFLQETARRRNCRVIALGHHQGDQAETVLHRLLRGSGASGLAGMRPANGPFIRPLLAISRAQIRSYLEANGIGWVEDASNADPRFTRNRIRHDLLPQLACYNPRVEEGLARLGGLLALEEDFWQSEVGRVLGRISRPADGGLRLGRAAVLALHPALRARVVRQALCDVRGDLRGVSAIHLELLLGLLAKDRPQADLRLPGVWAGVRYGDLWLRPVPPLRAKGFSLTIVGPGTIAVPGGGTLLISLEAQPQGEGIEAVEFDPAAVSFPLVLRSFRPGDRIRPSGMNGSRKVKDLLMEAKIEREVRAAIPLLAKDEVLWIPGIRRCEGRRPAAGGPALRLTFEWPRG